MGDFLRISFVIAISLFVCPLQSCAVAKTEDDASWTSEFGVEEGEQSATNRN